MSTADEQVENCTKCGAALTNSNDAPPYLDPYPPEKLVAGVWQPFTVKRQEDSYLGTQRNPKTVDAVNHPPHYTAHPSGVECIEITEHMNFNLGNVVKYLWRAEGKNGIEDLEKARWYLNREIVRVINLGLKS